jgi:PKHD-type hydroxylase
VEQLSDMILAVSDVLSAADLAALRNGLAEASFVSGEASAGWSARLVKSNLQASDSPEIEAMRSLVQRRLMEHPVLATSRAMLTAPMSTTS